MNVTLSLDTQLVKKLRKIAIDRDTTLTGMVRDYLESIVAEETNSGRRRRELEKLEHSFESFQVKVGNRNWKRQDLYVRS